MKKLVALLCIFACAFSLIACGEEEGQTEATTTTVTGMVIEVNGTEIKVVEMGAQGSMPIGGNFNPENFQGGNFNPEDFQNGNFNPENFQGGNFNPEDFQGGNFNPENFQGGNFNPEDFQNGNFNPENFQGGNFNPENFQGGNFNPEDFQNGNFDPENMPQMPEGSFRPEGSARPGFSQQMENMESKTFDIKDAHISVEIENGKAEGSMEDITVGKRVTITLDKDNKVTNVLVSESITMGNRPSRNNRNG